MTENYLTDQKTLKEVQYRQSNNLNARIRLHELFSVADQTWFSWIHEQLQLFDREHILEMGCGTGSLWVEMQTPLPVDCKPVLCDLSIGMLHAARGRINDPRFIYCSMDAQTIAAPNNAFDLIIANHMLYHVPDLPGTLREIRRVLKPGGRLLAATNGCEHMSAIYDLVQQFNPSLTMRVAPMNFNLENGTSHLQAEFDHIECLHYQSCLHITQIQPLLDYYASMQSFGFDFSKVDQIAFAQFLENQLAKIGKLIIHKAQGLFIAS